MLVGHFAISLLSPITESFQSFFFSCILKYTTVMCCGVSLIFFFSWLLVSVNNGHQFWEFSSIYFLSLISVLGQLFFFFFLLGELFFSFNLLALFVMNFSRKFLFEHTIKFNFGVCVCVCLCRHARCLQRSEEVPRTKVLDNCEIPCGSWELNPGLLEESAF